MSLALGIDLGTSGVRSAVVDASGAVMCMARVDHLPQEPEHIDAENWWRAVAICVARQIATLEELGRSGREVTRIAVDGTSGTMVLTDASLRPVTRALMYNSKGFETEAMRIAPLAPRSHITQGANSALARALRLVAEDGDNAARHLLHQADFIAARLMGCGGHSDHNNALKTGFDPGHGVWPDWIGALIDPALLPEAHPVGTVMGGISGAVAADLGVSVHAEICAGTTDSIAAFLAAAPIGAGMEAGLAVTSLGSTLAVKMLSPMRIDAPEIGLYAHRIGESWLVGGASNTGGAVLAQVFDSTDLARLSAQIDPDSPTGLDYYPLLRPGERFPINDPDLAPRMTPRPDSDALFLQGLMEGIARIEAQCYAEIAARGGGRPRAIYSAGGGAANPVFARIRARALGLVPSVSDQSEAAVGVARLAQAG